MEVIEDLAVGDQCVAEAFGGQSSCVTHRLTTLTADVEGEDGVEVIEYLAVGDQCVSEAFGGQSS
ncbi:MAG: hypothetical protein HY720_20570, partial [Planctomycetes bacterium]|nr:hypothetical protein [Planctomycetota bacterium]